jgi:hypothetical protein
MKGFWNVRWLLLAVFVVVLVSGVVWLVFFDYDYCKIDDCFYDAMEGCERVQYISGGGDMVYRYFIMGKDDGYCKIRVKLLQANLNEKESEVVEGREMVCRVPLGVRAAPEDDMRLCSGALREGLQELIIQRMHDYLIENLDDGFDGLI